MTTSTIGRYFTCIDIYKMTSNQQCSITGESSGAQYMKIIYFKRNNNQSKNMKTLINAQKCRFLKNYLRENRKGE